MNALEKYDLSCLHGKSVLVTGTRGLIGSELISNLRAQGINCLGIDKLKSTNSEELCFNLCEKNLTIQAIDKFSPDCLIHCGTYSAIAYQENFIDSFEEDALALSNILNALKNNLDTQLIFFSSSYVYSGLESGLCADESSILQPAHNFGVAKAFFEQLILRSHSNSVVFRLTSVFGAGNRPCPNAISDMMREFQQAGKITVWGKGSRNLQYIFLDDVISYTTKSLILDPGIYNLGGNDYFSISKVANLIGSMIGASVSYLQDKKEGETLPFLKNKKLKDATRLDIYTPLEQALLKYIESQLGVIRK